MERGPPVLALALLVVAMGGGDLSAQGHGPVYGLSTPTLGRGGWSLDVAGMVRMGGGVHAAMLRPMLSYGITEDIQVSGSVPVPVSRDPDAATVRGFTRMPATRDLELMLGWRFQRSGIGVGSRVETTVWLAFDVPTDDTRSGVETAPALFGSMVTGYASRSLYVWAGGGHRRSLDGGGGLGDRAADVTMASLVVGYRPQRFREDYPAPDWRGFVEIVGEWVGRAEIDGLVIDGTGGRQIYAALTVLGLYGSWGLAGGPAVPVLNDMRGDFATENVRLAANVSFWF